MAIQDRNLTAGTKLWAKYKGTTHTAEVVEVEGSLRYRLADGREFKSPSAAGGAVFGEGRTCNGWAFWTVGEPPEPTKAEEPKPKSTRRRKEAPKNGNGDVLPIIEQVDGRFECGNCGTSFPTQAEAAAHIEEAHAKPPAD
jgi:hypothetical protein